MIALLKITSPILMIIHIYITFISISSIKKNISISNKMIYLMLISFFVIVIESTLSIITKSTSSLFIALIWGVIFIFNYLNYKQNKKL
jgi:Flp pilus assembly protein protease CpaA